jgi:lipoyl(octanoyl) transferase
VIAAPPLLYWLGCREYPLTLSAMQRFTARRTAASRDQIWCLEHPPVYTLGQAGRPEHVLAPGAIPVIRSDRGGQVTYHGPGQLVVYLLLDLRVRQLGVRALVTLIERSLIDYLATQGIDACARADAPGVYVDGAKIAALGLRVSRGCSYHGLALNVGVDLRAFLNINPCGYAGLAVTRLADLAPAATDLSSVAGALLARLLPLLGHPPEVGWAAGEPTVFTEETHG